MHFTNWMTKLKIVDSQKGQVQLWKTLNVLMCIPHTLFVIFGQQKLHYVTPWTVEHTLGILKNFELFCSTAEPHQNFRKVQIFNDGSKSYSCILTYADFVLSKGPNSHAYTTIFIRKSSERDFSNSKNQLRYVTICYERLWKVMKGNDRLW